MVISITGLLASITEWIRTSGLVHNYVPMLLGWIGTGGVAAFIVCAFAIEGIARKIAKWLVTALTILIMLTFLQEAEMLPQLPIVFTW